MLGVLTVSYIDTSLYTRSHTYTSRLRIRTGRPADPLPGAVFQNTAAASYTLHIDIIAISYVFITYLMVTGLAGPSASATCHATRHGMQILRAGFPARRICAALHECAACMQGRDSWGGERQRKPPFGDFNLQRTSLASRLKVTIPILFNT